MSFLSEGGLVQVFDSESGKLVKSEEIIEVMKDRLPSEKQATLNESLSRPKYLLRVDLSPKTTLQNAIGTISVWRFPKIPKLDVVEQIYLCGTPKCKGVLIPELRVGTKWACPLCRVFRSQKEIGSGIMLYAGPFPFWGEKVASYYEHLEGLSDILLLRRRQSIQKMTNRVLQGEKNAEEDYLKSHGGTDKNAMEGGYFTMSRIHQDISNGGSLAKRIEVFLRGG